MTADKRSVATDALEVLGNIITDKAVGRDAIHLACEPVVAGEILRAGDHIGRLPSGRYGRATLKPLGIVDPFLTGHVMPEQKFLLVLYPRQITSLRHVWSHPEFEDEAPVLVEKVVTTLGELIAALDVIGRAADVPVSGDRLYDAMDDSDGYIHVGDQETHASIDIPASLWAAYETINGHRAARDPRNFEGREGYDKGGLYFTCGC